MTTRSRRRGGALAGVALVVALLGFASAANPAVAAEPSGHMAGPGEPASNPTAEPPSGAGGDLADEPGGAATPEAPADSGPGPDPIAPEAASDPTGGSAPTAEPLDPADPVDLAEPAGPQPQPGPSPWPPEAEAQRPTDQRATIGIPTTPSAAIDEGSAQPPSAGTVVLSGDPAAIDYGVDVRWAPQEGSAPLGYQLELFAGTGVANGNALIARVELDGDETAHRFESIGFGRVTVTARLTPLDGAGRMTDALVSEPLTLHAASAGALSSQRAGTPRLGEPSADGFRVDWDAAASDAQNPPPSGYLVRVFERLYDMNATSANNFVTAVIDAGDRTTLRVTGLSGASRYLAAVVAYDLVDGQKRYRTSSATSAVPAWSAPYAAQTLGARAPGIEWSNKPAAPVAVSARSLSWKGAEVTGRFAGGSAVTAYRVELYESGFGLRDSVELPAVPGTAPTAEFGGLRPGAGYSVRYAAVNANGVGGLSDYGARVTLPQASEPGTRVPPFADRAALDEALRTGAAVRAGDDVLTVEAGETAQLAVPWGDGESGEVWWFGSGSFAGAVEGAVPAASVRLSTSGLGQGRHYAVFFTDASLDGQPGAPAPLAVAVQIVPSTAGVLDLDDAVLRWGINDESNNGAYFGGCNFLSAGRSPDAGGAKVFEPAQFASSAGEVSIEKPDAQGRYRPATWQNKCLDRTGRTLSSGSSSAYGESQFVFSGGGGTVEPATNSAEIRWTGDVTVAYYGGMSFWYLSDPVLRVVDGVGTLTATVGGFGTDMDDLDKWEPLAEREVTLAVLHGVQTGREGFTITPDYRGVAVDTDGGRTPQSRSGPDWGSFPQDFVDFHTATGQSAYWYSSGGQADAAKPALPVTVGYIASEFTPPPPPPANGGGGEQVVPPPVRNPPSPTAPRPASAAPSAEHAPPVRRAAPAPVRPAAPALADPAPLADAAPAAVGSVVVIQQAPVAETLDNREVLLFAAVLAGLLLIALAAAGGGVLIVSRVIPIAPAARSTTTGKS
ncbi:fibronectin type III domain-containing protein [Compostimonas suwonensis]|uniref:Fibronectin type III domain protein n=1 Tax=Compostimonas suwonensis TaxID=1048394 RepID=A0A2M9C4R6_9MICO|nr:HtaA domain-containing protein [Compostimonas suwonensis]PJJ65489.1 fibronectin type III domain protein [Compostimonas suwonensis]